MAGPPRSRSSRGGGPGPGPGPAASSFAPPLPYRLFFLYVEPASAVAGAACACLRPADYLALTTHTATAATPPDLGPSVALAQLANLYLLFAVNEALVLRAAAADARVWRALLLGLLVADLGHLAALAPLGAAVYWDVARWNAMDWGNVAFVYLGAAMRLAFLLGVGLGPSQPQQQQAGLEKEPAKARSD